LVSEELNQRNQELRRKLLQLEDTYNQLGESLAVLDSIFDATGEAILAFDSKSRLIRFNQMAQEILGIEQVKKVYGSNRVMRTFFKILSPEEEFSHELRKLNADPGCLLFGVIALKDRRLFEYHSTPQLNAGQLVGRVWCFRNVTKIKENEALVKYQAFHDSLTELPNRVLLIDRLNHAIKLSNRQKDLLAILFIDLDHFKKVNDTAGHQLGDELLIEVAKRIKGCLREHDTLARFGGDEFVVLLENIKSHRVAAHTCQRINLKLTEPFELDGNLFHISSSIGVSIYPRDDHQPEELIRKADMAMYHAKEKGRGTFEFFDSPLERIAQFQLELENRLRDAFLQQQLTVFYQPQVDTKEFKVRRSEALIRWFPKDGPPISPADFIPVAERAGFIKEIGYWVLEQVCQQISKLKTNGVDDVRMAINLSAQQFADETLVDQIMKLMQKYKVEGQDLELEITESMLLEDLEKVSAQLTQLRKLNISIAIDDFGTGYSSLKYLQKLPIDSIKIDRSFIQELSQNPGNQSIVNAIISLGHNLKLDVVAEGVEDKAIVEFLCFRQCDYIQGYYFYKPMPADELLALLTQQRR
ncbi:MAG: EAL domain-containing protein, partial [Kangiellaceae bacterium]|nr:EAL domain-containing protein [Kangiellaceae bacterium]